MSNFIFIQRNVDVSAILNQLYSNMGDWYEVGSLGSLGGKRDIKDFLPITMGSVASEMHKIKDSQDQINTPFYHKYTEMVKWLDSVGCSNHSRAAFIRLPIDGRNNLHIDDGEYYKSRDRYHLSLQGSYLYHVDGEEHVIEPGTFFWFNNKKIHSAINIGEEERITFVFDVPHSPNNPHHKVDLIS